MRLSALKQQLAATVASMEDIIAGATETVSAEDGSQTTEPRDLTAEEQAQFDALKAKASGLQAQIAREEQVLALKAQAATPIAPLPGAAQGVSATVPAAPKEPPAPGVRFARIAQVLAIGRGDLRASAYEAERLYGSEMAQIVANMEQSTATKGGFLVDTAYSRDFIEFLRPQVVIRNMGARSVPMPEGNLTMRKATAGTAASYVGERVPAPATDATIGQITMSAKRLTALVAITNQLIRRASIDVETMIRDDLARAVAVKEDQQFLRGVGSSTAPTGLRNLVAAGNVIPANATVNLVNVTNDLGKLRLAVMNANIPMTRCGYIMSPRTAMFLENLRDGNGNRAFPEVSEGRLGIYPIGITTSVPDNLGAGSNQSEVYFGDFNEFLIGDTGQIAIAASDVAAYDDGGTLRAAFSNDETVVRVIAEHDTALRYDTAFAVLTGVTWTP